ncbi:MAG: glycosyltransferase family 4 protein [Patescibacteria group bacterium]|nr:glycosyltransferase family 4 protein [Patescibacteria group bacterium]MCL5431578.1 glycosyltransferase family 4 protein [Patescibacteria group bacterium]
MIKIITTSSLIPRNGIDVLINACKLLAISYQLVIAGDGPERAKLEKLAADMPVKFLGRVPNNLVPSLLVTSHLFVRPSRFEGFGSSFIEAMAAGLPVIGTPVGGIVDFLKDGQTGLLVPPDDPPALAAAITRLTKDKKLAKKLSEDGRELVEKKYRWDKIADHVYLEMKKLCG